MPLEIFSKQPRETRSFDVLFGDYLDVSQDTARAVNPVEVDVVPTGITLLSVDWVPETRRLKFWVSGGENLGKYLLTAWLNTTGGERLEAEIRVDVKEKT